MKAPWGDGDNPSGAHFGGLYVWWRYLIDNHLQHLKLIELKVLLVILGHADNETGHCWPSLARIARLAGCKSKGRICEALRSLERLGLIETVKTGGGKRSTLRRLKFVKVAEQDRKAEQPTGCENRIEVVPVCKHVGADNDTGVGPINGTGVGTENGTQTTHGTAYLTTHSNYIMNSAANAATLVDDLKDEQKAPRISPEDMATWLANHKVWKRVKAGSDRTATATATDCDSTNCNALDDDQATIDGRDTVARLNANDEFTGHNGYRGIGGRNCLAQTL